MSETNRNRVIADFTDKIACRDEILFEISASVKYIKLTEELIDHSLITRKSYTDHVYSTTRSESADDIAIKDATMDRDLRLQYIAERLDQLDDILESNKAVLEDQKIRLLRINKIIDGILRNHPFLKAYQKK